MAGIDHGAGESKEIEHESTITRNARRGLILFTVYFVFYAGFVVVNAFRPDLMERTPFAGINLAVVYGFALIVGALVMSLVYGWLCQSPAASIERQGDAE